MQLTLCDAQQTVAEAAITNQHVAGSAFQGHDHTRTPGKWSVTRERSVAPHSLLQGNDRSLASTVGT